jgi:hypothetical protein
MADPRLNSLHLDPSRRQEYRRARDQLLESRGCETIYVERQRVEDSGVNNTLIRQSLSALPPAVECWLTDREFVYPLKVGLNTMGRSADNDVIVEDLYVSRRHCAVLMHHDTSCVLQDTASKNGTYVNGAKIAGPTALRPGDRIRICNREYVFHNRAAAPDGPPAGPSPTRTIAG